MKLQLANLSAAGAVELLFVEPGREDFITEIRTALLFLLHQWFFYKIDFLTFLFTAGVRQWKI